MATLLSEAGATVLIMGRSPEALHEVAAGSDMGPGRVMPFTGDASVAEDIAQALEEIIKVAGKVDGWVNNAYSGGGGRLLEQTRDQVDATTRGLGDVILATQRAAQAMIACEGSGSIVNIASMYGMVSPYPEVYSDHRMWHSPPAYGAVKAGVIQFTRYAATHLAPAGVRVNCVSPGPFPSKTVQQDAAFIERLTERVPLARIGQAHEVAGAVLFLLSDAASYITGANLAVDGGWTAW
jgi:gluconate 5-dehydrogenase